jgi:hypothetical protein
MPALPYDQEDRAMMPKPKYPEIDHRTLKLIVGVIAITFASLTSIFAGGGLKSISAAFHVGGWSQSFFVGFLFATAAFLLAYNGMSRLEMVLSKLAAVAALGVALFPCQCEKSTELVPYVHYVSAAVMFLVLAYFCWIFYQRARDKGHAQAKRRTVIYAACAVTIVVSIATLVLNVLLGEALSRIVDRLVFYGEAASLVAFGVSWLTASRVLPVLSSPDERLSLFS